MPVTARDINEMLFVTGERERLRRVLKDRLEETGWKTHMTQFCQQLFQEHGSNLKFEDLILEIAPVAKAAVSPDVKQEMVQRIQEAILEI